MGTIVLTQPGGVGVVDVTTNARVVVGTACRPTYVGTTTSWTWACSGGVTVNTASPYSPRNPQFVVTAAGTYTLTFTDSFAAQTQITFYAVAAPSAQSVLEVDSYAAARALSPAQMVSTDTVVIRYRATIGDGGGGVFVWDSSSTTTDDNGATLQLTGVPVGRLKRQIVNNQVDVSWFGAVGDATHISGVTINPAGSSFVKSGFASTDIGKLIKIDGAGVAGVPHITTIANVSGTTVTLTAATSVAVTNAQAVYATDDTAAIQAALNVITLSVQGGTVEINTVRNGGQWAVSSTLVFGNPSNPSTIGCRVTSNKRARDTLNGHLLWMGPLHGTLMKIRASHAGCIDAIGFDGNGLADYGLQFDHELGDTVTEHWQVKDAFFTGARVANALIGVRIADGIPSANTGDLQNIKFDNVYFLQSQITGVAPTYHLLQRSPNAVGNTAVNCQFTGANDAFSPQYGVYVESGSFDVYSFAAVGMNAYDFAAGNDGTNVPGAIRIFGGESQSAKLLSVNTAGGVAAPQRPCGVWGVYQADIFGAGASHSIYVKSSGYAPVVLDCLHIDNHIFIDNTTSIVCARGVVFNSGKGYVGVGSGLEEGSYYDSATTKFKRRLGEIIGNIVFDSSLAWFIQQTKRSGTGANAGNAGKLKGQTGQDQTGGAANNNGGSVTIEGGDAGTGGSGAAGAMGVVGLVGSAVNMGGAAGATDLTVSRASATYVQMVAASAMTTGLKLVANAGSQALDFVTNAIYASADSFHFRNTAQGADQLVVTTTGGTVCNVNAPNGIHQCEGATGVELRSNGTTRFKCDNTGIGFFGASPTSQQAWSAPTNHTDRTTLDETATTLAQLANNVGTLIIQLRTKGLLG